MIIHGLIVVAKDKGLTSHEVVQKIRHIFQTKRAGHFGTLDPSATGVLLIALGNVTRFFNFFVAKTKHYHGTIRFGFATNTYDSEGTPLSPEREIDLHRLDIPGLLSPFVGTITQTPPPYSAKKFKGKPLYSYARKNIAVQPTPAQVIVFRLEGEIVDSQTLHFDAETSSGTYIRSLAHDIGQKTGVGAYLADLQRLRIGEFRLEEAHTLEEIAKSVEEKALERVVIPFESLLPEFSKIIVSAGGKRNISNGMPLCPVDILRIFPSSDPEHFRIFDDEGKFLAVAAKDAKLQLFRPTIVFPEKS